MKVFQLGGAPVTTNPFPTSDGIITAIRIA